MCVYERRGLLLRLTVLDRSCVTLVFFPVYILHRIILPLVERAHLRYSRHTWVRHTYARHAGAEHGYFDRHNEAWSHNSDHCTKVWKGSHYCSETATDEIWDFLVANYSTIVFGLILYAGPFYTIWKRKITASVQMLEFWINLSKL